MGLGAASAAAPAVSRAAHRRLVPAAGLQQHAGAYSLAHEYYVHPGIRRYSLRTTTDSPHSLLDTGVCGCAAAAAAAGRHIRPVPVALQPLQAKQLQPSRLNPPQHQRQQLQTRLQAAGALSAGERRRNAHVSTSD